MGCRNERLPSSIYSVQVSYAQSYIVFKIDRKRGQARFSDHGVCCQGQGQEHGAATAQRHGACWRGPAIPGAAVGGRDAGTAPHMHTGQEPAEAWLG